MEKINHYMPTPLTLECFCEECSNNSNSSNNDYGGSVASGSNLASASSRHVYKLYSVIMHQGATMTAGHYIAYTKVPEDSMYNEYACCDRDCHRQNISTSANGSSSNSSSASSSILKYFKSKSNISESKEHLIKMACRSLECCSIRRGKQFSTWLECDDEAVKAIQEHELLDKLSPNSRNSATPYLLFYVRTTT